MGRVRGPRGERRERGATDTRPWRCESVPANVTGPVPAGMGSYDEHVEVEEFLHTVRTHVLSAYDYLTRG